MKQIDNIYDEAIKEFLYLRVNLFKECLETLGIDLGDTKNELDYDNYLAENPLQFGGLYGGEGLDSEFGGAAAGKEPIPPGFYSDQVLYEFISHAEGNVGMRWVTTYKGDTVATRCGIGGWDYAGGVHSPAIAKAIGVSPNDFASWVTIDKNSGFSRKAMGGEITEGAAWGWATSPIQASNPYWQKLIPYYRDQMIWAWNQPIIQNVKDPAERLARMHSINWWGYHYLKGFNGGSGWPHRFQAAQRACAGMPRFA